MLASRFDISPSKLAFRPVSSPLKSSRIASSEFAMVISRFSFVVPRSPARSSIACDSASSRESPAFSYSFTLSSMFASRFDMSSDRLVSKLVSSSLKSSRMASSESAIVFSRFSSVVPNSADTSAMDCANASSRESPVASYSAIFPRRFVSRLDISPTKLAFRSTNSFLKSSRMVSSEFAITSIRDSFVVPRSPASSSIACANASSRESPALSYSATLARMLVSRFDISPSKLVFRLANSPLKSSRMVRLEFVITSNSSAFVVPNSVDTSSMALASASSRESPSAWY